LKIETNLEDSDNLGSQSSKKRFSFATADWWLANRALSLVAMALGSRPEAIRLIHRMLVGRKLHSSAKNCIFENDVGPVNLTFLAQSEVQVIKSYKNDSPGHTELESGFWESVAIDSKDSGKAFWREGVFATGAGSEPLLRIFAKGSKTGLLAFQNRIVAYQVHFDFRQIRAELATMGKPTDKLIPLFPADDFEPSRKQRRKSAAYDWDKLVPLKVKAQNGRLSDEIGPSSSKEGRSNLRERIIELLGCALGEEPSQATLYRKIKKLLEIDEKARRALHR
jgi:hypothetical protein